MIFFEGFNQGYTVEELSFKQAEWLMAQQVLEEFEINEGIEQVFNQAHSYRTRLDVDCKSSGITL